MTDDLIVRIRAHRSAPDVYYAPEPSDMQARILADAEALKAADELAEAVELIHSDWMLDEIAKALAAYRKARVVE